MALINPWVLYIGVPVIIVLCLISFKRKDAYLEGKKVANTSLIEETAYFKKLYREYKLLKAAVVVCIMIAIAMCFVMLSRPAKIDTITEEIRNRDIFLCMDISDSVDDLNLDMCDELKKVVQELDGERFGISIFNGQSVLLVPLTTDYDYVLNSLDSLKEAFKDSIKRNEEGFDYFNQNIDWSTYYYKYEGTLAEEGSSFIGDGLASALYSFPDLETNKDRSRMIIFTTDNELNGEPYVTVEEAAALCKKNDVKVFAIAPENVTDENTFRTAMESTSGGYYKATSSKAYKQLVEDIKKTKTSRTGVEKKETKITDQPQKWFVWMLLCFGVYLVICKRLKF
ncbi:MAG: VWA domain-containing protein [Lachnospiraceae bacterium]|nr:VWA domain-containing protein [Lachnospiraceae bacterium]